MAMLQKEKRAMSKFELFCMMAFILNAERDETGKDLWEPHLRNMNSLLFEDLFSADFSAFTRFCEAISDEITLENSYAFAKAYFSIIGRENAIARINPCEWEDYVAGYLFPEDSESVG